MPRSVYADIIQNDIAGRTEQREDKFRSFVIPSRWTIKNSSPTDPRTINILAAFVSPMWVWALVDFTRLARFHVTSRDQFYTASDFVVRSPVWLALFTSCFQGSGGPDWILERQQAEDQLDLWRSHVLEEYATHQRNLELHEDKLKLHEDKLKLYEDKLKLYEDKLKLWKKKVAPHASRAITTYFSGSASQKIIPNEDDLKKKPKKPKKPVEPAKPKNFNRPIIKDMSKNIDESFTGYGRHCINDGLHFAGIHPGTPSWYICISDILYNEFKLDLFEYMNLYEQEKFLKLVVTIPNSRNSFDFNEKSNREYISAFILVFRRCKVCYIYFSAFLGWIIDNDFSSFRFFCPKCSMTSTSKGGISIQPT